VIGVDKMMWGSDYPHPEGTWPHTGEQLRETFREVPEDELRPIVGLNAAKVYNFDVERLQPIVERIGPTVGELAGVTY
jgi:predicted TIM-barrel fold metal-dependent hydrolase